MGFVGATVPAKHEDIFRIVAEARDAAIRWVRDAYAAGVTQLILDISSYFAP